MTRMTRNMRYLPLIVVVTMFTLIAATCHTDEPAVSSEDSSESSEAEEEFRLRIIERAQEWLPIGEDGIRGTPINYSLEDDSGLGGYRADCSGYINYAWDIPEDAPGGLNTENLMNFGRDIPINDLAPGDILVSNPSNGGSTNHGLIFVKWIEKSEGSIVAYEQNWFYKGATRRDDLLLYDCGESFCRIRGQGEGNWGPYYSYMHPYISEIRASTGLTLIDPVLADSPSLELLAAEQGLNGADQCLQPLEQPSNGEALIPEPPETEPAPLDRMDSTSVVQWIDLALQTGDISIFEQLTSEQLDYANYIEGGQLVAKQNFLQQLSIRWTGGPYCEDYTSENGVLRIWTGGWSPPWEMTELCYDGCQELDPPWQSETAAFFLSETSDGWTIETIWLNDRSYWEGLPFTSCDQAQLSNTEEAGAGEPEIIEGLAGLWEGTVSSSGEGWSETKVERFEIRDICESGRPCLNLPWWEAPASNTFDQIETPEWLEVEKPAFCYGEYVMIVQETLVNFFCFHPLDPDTLEYLGGGGLWSANGILRRVSEAGGTRVITYSPTKIPSDVRSGYCWSISLITPRLGAWRCMVNSQIFDPCFGLQREPITVVCGVTPFDDSRGFRLDLTEPLPEISELDVTLVWMIELEDGTGCTAMGGATGGFGGERINMACEPGWFILGEPQVGQIWTANKVRLSDDWSSIEESIQVSIGTVWR